jgi:acid stress-induced BolA-like protein IbaG/YrbA
MAGVKKHLRQVLEKKLRGAEVHLETLEGSGRIGGEIVWKGFLGLEPIERFQQLKQILEDNFEPEERKHISTLLLYTPSEMQVMREG